jgi:hypothetical protein
MMTGKHASFEFFDRQHTSDNPRARHIGHNAGRRGNGGLKRALIRRNNGVGVRHATTSGSIGDIVVVGVKRVFQCAKEIIVIVVVVVVVDVVDVVVVASLLTMR